MSSPSALHLSVRRLLGLVLVAGLALAAAAIGTDRIGYHVTDGVSMEPTHHAGDLVVVARADAYRTGEVVAYRGGRGDDVVVLHRITGGDASGYEIKGDNNQSVDPLRPSAGELVGREVLHIPRVGAALRSPLARILLLALVLALLGALTMRPRTRRPTAPAPPRAGWVQRVLVAVDVLLLVALCLTYAIVDGPDRSTASAGNQNGALAYDADVPVSDTYPTGEVDTGDPVFVRLLQEPDVTFRFATDDAPAPVMGTARLDVVVAAANGWRTTLAMVPRTPLVDGALELTAPLDVARIQALATRVAEETGLAAGTLTVTVAASTSIRVGDGDPMARRFELPFQLTPLALTLSGVDPSRSPDGPVVTSTFPLAATTTPVEAPEGPNRIRLGLLAALLLCGAATVMTWPTPAGSGRRPPMSPDNAAAAALRDLKVDAQLADLARTQLADQATIEALASALWRLTGAQGRPPWAPEVSTDGRVQGAHGRDRVESTARPPSTTEVPSAT